ncbi:MAG: hypothetical protein ACJARL_000085 [Halopseudomonas sp.]|jgi:hypothetical protein
MSGRAHKGGIAQPLITFTGDQAGQQVVDIESGVGEGGMLNHQEENLQFTLSTWRSL